MLLNYLSKFVLIFLFSSNLLIAQVSENFDNWTDGSYGGTSTYGEWVSNKGLTETSGSRSGKCVRLRNQSDSYLEYVGLDGNGKDDGVGVISFWYRSWDSSPTAVYNVQASINGAAYSNIGNQISTTSTTYTEWTHSLNNTENNIKIRIIYVSGERLKVDDFSITNFSGSTPGISLGSVSGNTNESGTTATFTAVLNAAPASDVVLNVTSGDTDEVTVAPSQLTFTSLNWATPQTITATGVNDDSNDDNVDVTITVAVNDGSSDDNYDGISTSTTVTNEDDDLPIVVISEIMYNSTGTDDEWIEVYNGNGADVDISNWTVVYSGTFTFPGSTTITDGDYITIALGSNGDGTYNNDNPFTPDFNDLTGSPTNANVKDTDDTNNIGNTSGTITLKNSSGTTIDVVDYDDGDASSTDGDGPSYEILDTTSDNSDTSTNWQASALNGGSPGKLSSTTWSGATDSDWSTSTNWSNGVPVATSDVLIPSSLNNYPTANSAVTVNSVTMNSGSSLIAQSTFSGTITYTRTLGTNNYYLLASPVVGETYDDTWVSNNGIATGTGDNRTIATYVTSNDTWTYFQAGSSATFQDGQGYAIRRSSSGTVSFTGTINTDNETETLTTTGNGFNLLGNPYPSYINSGSILSANSSSLDQQTIWLWNQATASYDTKVTIDAFKIAPGQGFFVKSDGSGDVSILESYQSHESDTFQRPQVNPEIYLTLTDDSKSRLAKIYYIEGTTTSFDNGYDGEMFGATSNAFAIYTHLVGNEQGQVGNSQGHGYAVQSLPTNNYENMIVPVGINATRGTTINIEATLNNFPEGINVYLADKQENCVTLLETDTSYSTTLEEDLNGVGRFYIHTTPNALSNGEVMDNIPLSIYSLDSETLTIEGVATGTAYLQLYTMLGEELLRTSFEGTGVNEILLPNHLNPGIYIVKIATATGVTTKKIMIN